MQYFGNQIHRETTENQEIVQRNHQEVVQVVNPIKLEKKQRIRGGDLDIDGRALVSSLKTGAEILELFKRMVIPEMKELKDSARQWVIKSLTPVLKCLENHFGNDSSRKDKASLRCSVNATKIEIIK